MICTSSYKSCDTDLYLTYSISGDRGKNAKYNGKCFPQLAPKMSFWKVWHDNIGLINEEDNNKYYVLQYYRQVLMKLDPEEIYKQLDGSVLLCYEENDEFCHRHIVAEWLQMLLELNVPEIKMCSGVAKIVERPKYIRGYLEEAMRKSINTMGFNSLRAMYLFYKSEELDQMARDVMNIDKIMYREYRERSYDLKCNADKIEAMYSKKIKLRRR